MKQLLLLLACREEKRREEKTIDQRSSVRCVTPPQRTVASPDSGQPLAGDIFPLQARLTIISRYNAGTHMCAPIAEGKAASRYKSKHQACVSLCVSPSLCVSVTQRESSSHLCLSAAPASLTNEARNDSSALHSASLSLPHNTVPLFIIIISRPPKTHSGLLLPYYRLSVLVG